MSLLNIDIDLLDVIDEFKLDYSQVEAITSAVSEALTLEIHRNWIGAAEQQLHSTRNNYIKGLILKKEDIGINSITLVGQLNNMIENGCSGFDMKQGFKNSPKVKYTKNGGWYLTIPFRIGTPDIIGESEVFSSIMPQEIYDIVKNQIPAITTLTGIQQNGESLKAKNIPESYNIPKTKNSVIVESINKTFDAYTHKSNIYEGIVRNQKTYENITSSTYNTFRRVSNKSDINSWIHQGIKEYNLADEALRNTDSQTLVDNTVDNILSSYGF